MENGGRRYSNREIRSIIHLAAKIEQREKTDLGSADGLPPVEIEAVAQGVGVGPELIRKAIAEYESKRSGGLPTTFFGAPVRIVTKEIIDRRLSYTAVEELRPKIETISASLGEDAKSLLVILTPRDNGTEIEVITKLHDAAGGIFGGLVGGLGLGAGLGVGLGVGITVLGSPLFMIAVPIASVTLGYLLSRTIYKSVVSSRRRRLRELMDRIRALF